MIKRSTRIAFEVLLALIAVMAVVVGVSLWRLSEKPLRVDFLSPYLEQSLALEESGFEIEIGETVLVWADWGRNLDLRARSIRLRDADGFTVASLPELSISLSLRALAQGVIAPTVIEAFGAQITLVRDETGRFDFGQGLPLAGQGEEEDPEGTEEAGVVEEGETTAPDLSILVPEILGELLSRSNPERPLSFLRELRLDHGQLIVYDRRLRRFWSAPSATIGLKRTAAGVTGAAALRVDTEFGRASFDLGVDYPTADGDIAFSAKVGDLHLGLLSTLDSRLGALADVDVIVGGEARATASVDGRLDWLAFDLTGGSGSITLPDHLESSLRVESLSLGGGFDWESRRFSLERAEARFVAQEGDLDESGPLLSASGSIDLAGPGLSIEVRAGAEDVNASELSLYWPTTLGSAAREWVTGNIPVGHVGEAAIDVALSSPDGALESLKLDRLSGSYSFDGLEVHYLRPLPPGRKIAGRATFDASRMAFELDGGAMEDVELSDGEIVIGLASEPETLDISLALGGPVATALELLDHERVDLISALGLNRADARGAVGARVDFAFPLIRDLGFEHVEVSVVANLTGVFLREVLLGRDASAGEFALAVDNDGMTLVGPVRLGDIPAALSWRESFKPDTAVKSLFGLSLRDIDEEDLAGFGLDLAAYLDGPLAASVDVKVAHDDTARIEAALDLTEATLTLPFLSWSKASGTAGTLELSAGLADGRLVGLDTIEARAGSLVASGRARLDETGTTIVQAAFSDLAFGGSRLSNVEVLRRDDGFLITVGGGLFDAAPFVRGERVAEGSRKSEEPSPGVRIEAPRLDTVSFGENRYMEEASLVLDRRPDGWEEIVFSARVPQGLWTRLPVAEPPAEGSRAGSRKVQHDSAAEGGEPAEAIPEHDGESAAEPDRLFTFRYLPQASGGYVLDASANDVGGLLRALDLRDTVLGGTLRIRGESPGRIPKETMAAKIRVDDFVLIRAPTLAKILSAASITGLLDALSGRGIRFDKLKTDVTAREGIVATDLLQAYGPGLGVTAKGLVDLNEGTVDLEGTVVPAYSVNSILGEIPILGPLLTGGEGQGLFAFVYAMDGSLDDPAVSVNPLSGLAPGFLRGLFGGIDGDKATVYPEGRE